MLVEVALHSARNVCTGCGREHYYPYDYMPLLELAISRKGKAA